MPQGARVDVVDVVVVGAGHNGLVAATFLARAGLTVRVVEEQAVVGGAVRTERPFARAPNLATSTGAYLLGLMPPELMAKLGLELPLLRRDPHYFLPTTGSRYLLLGSDRDAARRQFTAFFSDADWHANEALQAEIGAIRDDIAPTWLEAPRSLEETADRYVRPALRQVFIDLCRRPVSDYLDRFPWKSDLLRVMYAVTDGFTGLSGGWDSPGTGMNFLVHNMCRLPGSDGTWMIVKGGMGTVTQRLADLARAAGATIQTRCGVAAILREAGAARGVRLADGSELRAHTVVVNADPFRLRTLVGDGAFPAEFDARLEAWRRPGTTMKVNLALTGLPRFSCLPEDRGQYGTTTHLLPDEGDALRVVRQAYADAMAGRLPDFPTIEWYLHTPVDPSLKDEHGRHNSALFVQWVPTEIAGSSWAVEESGFVRHLLSICDRFAPGTSDLVLEAVPLHPKKIEAHFGITGGHIQHIDNSFGFDQRMPYATPLAGLYSASAGCHPAGAVIGAAGHNAAMKILADLGIG